MNPIGSGDSVAAGYAAGVVEGLSFLNCAVLGIACGAANAMTDLPGVVERSEVERLRKLVVVARSEPYCRRRMSIRLRKTLLRQLWLAQVALCPSTRRPLARARRGLRQSDRSPGPRCSPRRWFRQLPRSRR